MKLTALTTALVSLVVAVIVIALVAVPVIDDASRGTPYTGQNTGADVKYDYMDNPNFTFSWASNVTTVTIGGVSETLSITTSQDYPVIISDSLVVRVRTSGLTYYDLVNDEFHTTNNTSNTTTVSVVDGAFTLTQGSTTLTGTMSDAFVVSAKGDYGAFTGDPKLTLNQPYYVASFFNTDTNGPFRVYHASGDTLGAPYIDAFSAADNVITGGYTVTADIDYQTVGGNQAVGSVGDVDWTWTNGTDSGTSDYRYILAPIEYTSTPGTNDDTNSILLSIIPILLIITAIMIAVRLLRDY